ncbi:aminotransferase class V-fold PLP-dependent enzyme [Kaistia nematophila]|uniref:Aminotransferase class V-fold PLP-dependent enzyme n=1 Tax=Kaistia nematophila TaxID=2994654 RepID=A0A9X3DZK7_9HYPH|nr:aminotransferase class V-fold PLP-dependent enzyme [Hyphomicrobiales bacterium]MBN9058712.1 aminotransferase class V-fold PLP-dependent enzyme [Hyphomicrobiales bacterium]MCX5568336.1 aminotransferase class V-fold PLP-dependent enzyme [Kaistia nematophila]
MTTNLSQHFLLDPEVVFLNHGSFGACPRPVFEDYQRWQLKLERQPVEFLDSRRGLAPNLRVAREALAAEFGTSADNIAQVSNATTGLNVALQSLPLKPGDEILTTNHEYSALEKTLAFVARRTGAKIVVAEVPLPLTSAEAFHDAILSAVTPRTRVLFLSHVTSATALLFPIERLIAEARQRGIWSVIDGAHAPGHVPLDLDALGADVYSGNCHKWMMAPKGAAFVHVRPEWQAMIDPLVVSHGWTADNKEPGVRGPFGASAFVDEIEMQGTRDPSPWLAVPAALAFRRAHDWWQVAAECSRLAQETAARVRDLFGLDALSSPEFSAPQMVAMPIPACDPIAVHDALLRDYGIEIPVFEWQGHHIARLSCQGYNTREQMDLLVTALGELLAREQPLRKRGQA